LIRLTSFGRNAADFALADYLGRAVPADPTGCHRVASRDRGCDRLIERLRKPSTNRPRHRAKLIRYWVAYLVIGSKGVSAPKWRARHNPRDAARQAFLAHQQVG